MGTHSFFEQMTLSLSKQNAWRSIQARWFSTALALRSNNEKLFILRPRDVELVEIDRVEQWRSLLVLDYARTMTLFHSSTK